MITQSGLIDFLPHPVASANIQVVATGTMVETGNPTFGHATTATNLLVAWCATNSSSATFPITCSGSGWVLAGSRGGAFDWMSIWYKKNCGANETAPTFGGAGSDMWSQLAEFSGVDRTTGLDREESGAMPFTMSTLDTVGGELVIGGAYWNGSNSTGTLTLTAFTDNTGGEIASPTFHSGKNTFGQYFATVSGVAGSTGNFNHELDVTINVGVSSGGPILAVFKPQGSGPPPPPQILTTSLPDGANGKTYSQALAVDNGTPPYTWSVSTGSLPNGLTLSSGGLISGTPTVVATFNFTVEVTDADSQTATQALSIVVDATPPVIATLNYPVVGGEMSKYTASALDSRLVLAGNSGLPYVDLDVWGGVAGETVVGTVYSVKNWNLVIKCNNSGGGVTLFSNTGVTGSGLGGTGLGIAWDSYTYLVGGWNDTFDHGSNIVASACYDNGLQSTGLTTPAGQTLINELMFHFDFSNRGAGPWYAQNVSFGGHNVNVPGVGTIAIPVTVWSLAASGNALFWNLTDQTPGSTPTGQSDSSTSFGNLPIGAIDHLEVLNWLVTNGWIASGCTLTGFAIGYEVCDTGNVAHNFGYNDIWWYGG